MGSPDQPARELIRPRVVFAPHPPPGQFGGFEHCARAWSTENRIVCPVQASRRRKRDRYAISKNCISKSEKHGASGVLESGNQDPFSVGELRCAQSADKRPAGRGKGEVQHGGCDETYWGLPLAFQKALPLRRKTGQNRTRREESG
ncbi:hypothetical protein N7462_005340 [Penicillium macrosclerotiorum]|uniref:uncharacterized protein n=1 Tax=Penicillium macrosclerotiorum TaxID=303699 RepID=UPI002548D163|nr:uncharacterized protein N7462_005340 [Penicillium macrosclerotiorum]KAJ5682175.1 hypothetical protein N7462_005340 [Penicillium macrosclerotiorum]